ncbi:MAG: hypothetical protein NWE89_17200 [Candidatus Bathyarchaeota archaeon]|nr:hypothetical protein [Candidatus Bathyarchaeota archaeon]
MVDTEVKMNQLGLLMLDEMDNKKVIDVVGVGLKYFPHNKKQLKQEEYDEFNLGSPESYERGLNVLRGIEVKVSRSDFRNGFICTSCNYNYVLIPTRLVSPSVLPKGVGLIEYNRYKFTCTPSDEEAPERRPFKLTGLRVVRRATYRNLPQFQIDHTIAEIAQRHSPDSHKDTLLEVTCNIEDPELVYQAPV